jgi:hypothetical protein
MPAFDLTHTGNEATGGLTPGEEAFIVAMSQGLPLGDEQAGHENDPAAASASEDDDAD